MRDIDCRIRLTFVRRSGRGCDRPVVLLLPGAPGLADISRVNIPLPADRDLPTEAQWRLIAASLEAGGSASLVCDGLDHVLDVVRAVAIETGRVADPDLARAGGVV